MTASCYRQITWVWNVWQYPVKTNQLTFVSLSWSAIKCYISPCDSYLPNMAGSYKLTIYYVTGDVTQLSSQLRVSMATYTDLNMLLSFIAFVFLLCVKNLWANIFQRDLILGAVNLSSVAGGTSTAHQAGNEGGIVEIVAGQVKEELYETAGRGDMAVG